MRELRPSPFPWRRPRHELLLLALVAVAALSTVNVIDVQDASRFCLTDALLHGRVTIDSCIGNGKDRARHGGHLYSNKAPGMSILALPAAAVLGYRPAPNQGGRASVKLWLVRLFACGLPFLLCALIAGRLAEGLAAGTGGPALVTLALGTLVAPLAVTGFDHVPAAALVLGALAAAWARRPALAGAAAGLAVLFEYESAVALLCIGAYIAFQGRHALVRYAAGAVPGIAVLAAYDWIAFGAPWHEPLAYSDNEYRAAHHTGVVGIHLPSAHATHIVFGDPLGLFVVSPVLVAAIAGLVLLWRAGHALEVAVVAVVAAAYIVATCGYFDPYGGVSPGPRFVIPALPLLALGLAGAFGRARLPVAVLAALSVITTMTVVVTWSVFRDYPHGLWGTLVRVPAERGGSVLATQLSPNVLTHLGLDGLQAALVACVLAAAAFGVSLRRS